ncbi:Lar family restriction alleviation protein [Stenotrophomonas maltophilia]|uniref:Lar family restriction alleviation protein n=1 Tax=Stenotrophomonas maltophilia TaxID=40324 RepID=UPI0021CA3DA4|nr:Lar family restriction alleviation protein [Stenotrophomonas maltophilia]MCU1139248.1 Lar family restriction alleviation protein [Stenotrophomonas maltophilia]
MKTNDKTLADVQPGGMVRLGDALLPCPFCGNDAEFVPYKNNGLTLKCKSMGCIQRHQRTLRYGIDWLRTSMAEHWNTRALSAQPSPGGQGDAREQFSDWWADQSTAIGEMLPYEIARLGWQAALAARQPVESEENVAADTYWTLAEMIEPHVQREGINPDGALPASVHDSVAILLEHWLRTRQPVWEPVAWQSMATCPRDGTAVLLRWGEDHVSPGWWCAAVSPIQNEDGTWPRETGGFPWAFFDMNDGVAFVNHAVDTEYGPTHWAPYVYPPAQAVDLGAVREAVRKAWQKCAAGESVDLQFGTLLALIDSQAVGNG